MNGYLFVKKHSFLICSLLLVGILFAFHYWMAWPGATNNDCKTTLLLSKANWHPVIMSYLLQGMYFLFGIHIYHLLLLSLIPFYLGMWIFVYVCYKKTNSWFSLLCVLPCFIGNIFYDSFRPDSTNFSPHCVFLLYALVFYSIIVPVNQNNRTKKIVFYTFLCLVFIITLLSRHNAVFQVWPITFVWIGLYLNKKNSAFFPFLKRFIPLSFLSGLLCSFFLLGLNSLLTKTDLGNVFPAQPTLVHQIVGMCAPELDESCFEFSWWTPHWAHDPQRMIYLKERYESDPGNADRFVRGSVFKDKVSLDGRVAKWFFAVKKYPMNLIKHIMRYYGWSYFQANKSKIRYRSNNLFVRATDFAEYISHFSPLSEAEWASNIALEKKLLENEKQIQFSPLQHKIDRFLQAFLPFLEPIYFVIICFILFLWSCFVVVRKRDALSLLFFAASSAGVLSSLLIPAFTPSAQIRYMNPVVICAVVGTIIVFSLYAEYLKVARNKIVKCISFIFSHGKLLWKNI